jgi:hypothetical protein
MTFSCRDPQRRGGHHPQVREAASQLVETDALEVATVDFARPVGRLSVDPPGPTELAGDVGGSLQGAREERVRDSRPRGAPEQRFELSPADSGEREVEAAAETRSRVDRGMANQQDPRGRGAGAVRSGERAW